MLNCPGLERVDDDFTIVGDSGFKMKLMGALERQESKILSDEDMLEWHTRTKEIAAHFAKLDAEIKRIRGENSIDYSAITRELSA